PDTAVAAGRGESRSPRLGLVIRHWQCDKENHGWREGGWEVIMQESYKYWAFISYSHVDEKQAAWLHKTLETYRVPRQFVGRQSRDGKLPQRLFPIFRDREELAGSPDLSTKIREALVQSRYLVVVCSPQ